MLVLSSISMDHLKIAFILEMRPMPSIIFHSYTNITHFNWSDFFTKPHIKKQTKANWKVRGVGY